MQKSLFHCSFMVLNIIYFILLLALPRSQVNRSESEVGEKIREYTNNSLKYVFDTIPLSSSVAICAVALLTMSESRALYAPLLPVNFPRDDVDSGFTMAYTCWGRHFREEIDIVLRNLKIMSLQPNMICRTKLVFQISDTA
ncbi:2d240c96-c24e-458e-8ca6-47cfdb71d081 [Sclerotinia trifoliorum]|uniref:2d240c96-c24e-458e-8ca6-47cfdb71d081 n=1 Tax=Sclerotinia trifoliorum TaxID=28548 RepID=A0A8H2VRI7_9HELO|nr:2d240c96-c24e-458e-8ca6-47cfdb71d081 [Sclerotinia trifoliorum]